MSRSRLTVLSSLSVAVLGALAAGSAFVLDPARAAVGPLPAEALVLPADASFLVGLDVRRFVASPFYRKFAGKGDPARPRAFLDLEEKTGLDPERDVDGVILAGSKEAGRAGEPSGVAFVTGRFDRSRLAGSLESRPGVTWKKLAGTTAYLFREDDRGAAALAFLDDRTLVLGSQAAVEAVVTAHAEGARSLRGNAALMEPLAKLKPGSTFWMVGGQSLLAQLPATIPAPGAGTGDGASLALPALTGLAVSGDLEPEITLNATAAAADAAAAGNLADIVRGLWAVAALQARQKPELASLSNAVNVTTEGNQVHLTARFPYELDALLPQRKGGGVASTDSGPIR
jgi:hypothetical protein